MVIFQAISWHACDDETTGEYIVRVFGRTECGQSVCVSTPFPPYFFVQSTAMNEEKIDTVRKNTFQIQTVRKKDLWGFQNNETHLFKKLNFRSLADMKKSEYSLLKQNVRIYESNIDPFLRMMHRTGIKSTGWLQAEGDINSVSRCAIDIHVDKWNTLQPVDRDDIAPFKVMSFDIETNSSTGKFPDPEVEGDAAFQIGCTTRIWGTDTYTDEVCFCYKKTSGPRTESFDTECAMLEAFAEHVRKVDPDVITGYNIFGFDLRYIYKRAQMFARCSHKFYQLGRLKLEKCELVTKRLSSGALGDNVLNLIPMSGRYVFDLFHEIKREKKLDSYSLNNVSKLFLNDTKIDMPVKEMFRRYREGTPDELGEVADYCIKDTLLPHHLLDKLCMFTNLLEMAKATWVPLSYLSERGQQIKVFSQITRKARELGFLVPTIKKKYNPNDDDKYEGATVLEAHIDAYYRPITALDFASLYPSIMMAHNLCFSTLVMDPVYRNVAGVKYEDFDINERSMCRACSGKGCDECGNTGDKHKVATYRFAQDVPSLLPAILDELKQFRKKAKKLMAEHRGTQMEEVYNGQQLAYKISMNSIYGFCGAKRGMLPCVPIAASTTCQGRNMIGMTKKCVEENFPGATVRYGDTDSVMIEFDCKGMEQPEAIKHSWRLGEEAAEMCNKLFKKPNDLELEKVYCPYILYSKKRYAAKMWTKNRAGEMEMEKIDVKGLQMVRRDNTPYTREVCQQVLEKILESNDPGPAIECGKRMAQKLIDGEVPIEKLTMSKSLSDKYKVKDEPDWNYSKMVEGEKQVIPSQPHVQVLEKINERTPGAHPHTGDRVPFVLVKHEDPRAKMFEKAEDPQYAKNTEGVELDYNYYFTNQLKKPIEDLLDPLIHGEDIFATMMPPKPPRRQKPAPKNNRTITEMFKAKDRCIGK